MSNDAFKPLELASRLMQTVRVGGLATLDAQGFPFASLVNAALDVQARPLLLLSELSMHTQHIRANPQVSLLLAERGKGDALTHPRLTLVGALEPCEKSLVTESYLIVHPKSALYVNFADFGFWTMSITYAHLNGGFGKATMIEGEKLKQG